MDREHISPEGGQRVVGQEYVLQEGPLDPAEQARLLYMNHSQYSPQWTSSAHTHSCAELFFVVSGQGTFHVRQESLPVTGRDVVVVNPNVVHTEVSRPESPLEYVVLGVEGLESLSGFQGCTVLHLQERWEEVAALLRLMLQEIREIRPGTDAALRALCQVVVVRLLRLEGFAVDRAAGGVSGPRVNRECEMVRRYMDDHFKENLSLDQLAALAHISKYYLAHSFRREFGVSPISYLISRRIRESRFLLRETDYSLSLISQILGFSSLSYFSQCFRRAEGMGPLEYRKQRQTGEGQETLSLSGEPESK